jgi:hypothetical protein
MTEPRLLLQKEAYLAMFAFLQGVYERSRSDDLGGLLGSLSLLPDGGPADPAFSADWDSAWRAAVDGKVDASMRLTK